MQDFSPTNRIFFTVSLNANKLPQAVPVSPITATTTTNNNNNNNDGGTTNSSVSDLYSINQVQNSVPPTPTKVNELWLREGERERES